MQVNIFVIRQPGKEQKRLLVLPATPDAAIPQVLHGGWIYFATMDISDKLLASSVEKVAADLAKQGHAIVEPTD